MSQHMRMKPKPKSFPNTVKLTKKIPLGELCVVLCTKDIYSMDDVVIAHNEMVQTLSKLSREGYNSMFSAFTDDLYSQVIEVQILFRKTQSLIKPKASVRQKQAQRMDKDKPRRSRAKPDKRLHLFSGKRVE